MQSRITLLPRESHVRCSWWLFPSTEEKEIYEMNGTYALALDRLQIQLVCAQEIPLARSALAFPQPCVPIKLCSYGQKRRFQRTNHCHRFQTSRYRVKRPPFAVGTIQERSLSPLLSDRSGLFVPQLSPDVPHPSQAFDLNNHHHKLVPEHRPPSSVRLQLRICGTYWIFYFKRLEILTLVKDTKMQSFILAA